MELLRKNIEKHLAELCRYPSRHVGSPGAAAAADYIERTFRSYGCTEVGQEKFPAVGWRFGSMVFEDLTANAPVPGAQPCFFSQSCNVEGVPLWLKECDLAKLEAADVQGRLCIVEFFSDAADIRGRNGIAEDLDRLGAAGAVFISDSEYHTTCAPSTKIQRSTDLKTLGAAVVAESGAYYLVNNKQHVFRLVIDAETFAHQASNVFAVRHGAGSKRLLLGAHYDAAPLTQGASDNAAGVSCILELARLLKDELPDVTLEFVAFDAEEYSVGDVAAGSGNYVKAHPERKWDLLMNFDSVGMHFGEEFLHVGRSEQLPEFESIYRKLPIKNAGDDRSFDRAGVPTFWFNTHEKFHDFHTPLDTVETLDTGKIAVCVKEAVRLAGVLFGN